MRLAFKDSDHALPSVFSVLDAGESDPFHPTRYFVYRTSKGYLYCDRCRNGNHSNKGNSNRNCRHCFHLLKYREKPFKPAGYLRLRGSRSAGVRGNEEEADDGFDLPDPDILNYVIEEKKLLEFCYGGSEDAPIVTLQPGIGRGVSRKGVLPQRYPILATSWCSGEEPCKMAECTCPPPPTCPTCGGAWSPGEAERKVFVSKYSFDFTYKSLKCAHCSHAVPYEPHADGFFPVNREYRFTSDFFADYDHDLFCSITTLRAHYKRTANKYAHHSRVVSRRWASIPGELTLTWPAFLAAYWLWVDYDGDDYDEDFECPTCAKLPMSQRVVTFDGTTAVAFQQQRLADIPVDQHGPPRNGASGVPAPALAKSPDDLAPSS